MVVITKPFSERCVDSFRLQFSAFQIKGTDCKSLLLYFYYGGMVCTAVKKYREAIYFFEAAVQVPATTLSHIMLEAYKKLILVSLIQNGEIPQPHKTSNQIVNR